MSTFSELELRAPLLAALEKIGFTEPTEIQEKSIRAFESGKNIIGQSQTGTGKTGAFVIPLLNRLDGQRRGVQALVLCPTRELAIQTQEEFWKLSLGQRGLKSVALYGGGGMRKQMEILERQNPRIVVGTPGRVRDLVDRKKLDLSGVEYFVLDEADRMLDMGFVDEVRWLWDQMPRIVQTLCFSATMPQELFRLLHQHLGEETIETIKIAPKQIVVEKINHNFLRVERRNKMNVLQELLERHAGQKIIIFTQTKRAVDHLAEVLGGSQPVFALHGDVQQYERIKTIRKFKANEAKILIATDVVGRGLNLDAVDFVLNYDVPQDPEAYVHRIGRTARAGAHGKAIMLVTEDEMSFVWAIEKANKLELTEIDFEENPVQRTDRRPRNFSAPKFARRGGNRGGPRGDSRGGRGDFRAGRSRGGVSRDENSRGGNSRGGNSRGNSRGGRPQGARSSSRSGDRRGGSPAKKSGDSREKDSTKYFLSGNVRRQFQVNERDW